MTTFRQRRICLCHNKFFFAGVQITEILANFSLGGNSLFFEFRKKKDRRSLSLLGGRIVLIIALLRRSQNFVLVHLTHHGNAVIAADEAAFETSVALLAVRLAFFRLEQNGMSKSLNGNSLVP